MDFLTVTGIVEVGHLRVEISLRLRRVDEYRFDVPMPRICGDEQDEE